MLVIRRSIVVDTTEATDTSPSSIIGVKVEWLLDDKRITLAMGGPRHQIIAKDVTIESVIEEPESPTADRTSFMFFSADGVNIDRISFNQSWRQSLASYRSQSFPVEEHITLADDASVIDCLAIEIPGPGKDSSRIALRDYLELKKDAQQLAGSTGNHSETQGEGPTVHPS